MPLFDSLHHNWTEHQNKALDQALLDRSRLADALIDLLVTVQVQMPDAPPLVLKAEAKAAAALESVGGLPEVIGHPV